MSDSEEIVSRLKVATPPWISHIPEKKMFGGDCMLFTGKIYVGETKEGLKTEAQKHHFIE